MCRAFLLPEIASLASVTDLSQQEVGADSSRAIFSLQHLPASEGQWLNVGAASRAGGSGAPDI